MARKETADSYGYSLYHGYGSNLDQAKELKNILKVEITDKTLMFLDHNKEYQEIVAKIKEYETQLYSVETDQTFFEDFSVYEDDPIDYRFSESKYEQCRRTYENYDALVEEHNKNIESMKNELAEIEKLIPNRKTFLLPAQRRAKVRLDELNRGIGVEKNIMDSEKRVFAVMEKSSQKQAVSDKCVQQNKANMDKLYARAAEIENAYLKKFVKEALKKHPFMQGITFDCSGKSFFYLLGLNFEINYSDSQVRHIHDLELSKVLDEQVTILQNEIFEEESKGFNP